MNHGANKQRGFTIIELMLAMSFIAALLLVIAFTILQLGTIYNKGLTLKEVNQTGRSISDELSRSIGASSSIDLGTNFSTNSAGGRLCTGQSTFIWNYAEALASGDQNVAEYQSSSDEVRLVKVPDSSGAYCVRTGPSFIYRDIRTADQANAVELLKTGDRTLNIHRFTMTSAENGTDSLTGQQLYTVSITIGTGDVEAITSDRTACLAPGQPGADFEYCAVQQFELVIRAGNRVN